MTEEQSKKQCLPIFGYMLKNKMHESTIESVGGLMAVIFPREARFKAIEELSLFIKNNPTEKELMHQASEIYKKYRKL